MAIITGDTGLQEIHTMTGAIAAGIIGTITTMSGIRADGCWLTLFIILFMSLRDTPITAITIMDRL